VGEQKLAWGRKMYVKVLIQLVKGKKRVTHIEKFKKGTGIDNRLQKRCVSH